MFAKESDRNKSVSITDTPQASEQNAESNRGFRLQLGRMQYFAAFFLGFVAIALALPSTVWKFSLGEGIDTGISISLPLSGEASPLDAEEDSDCELTESSSISKLCRSTLDSSSFKHASLTWSSSGSKKFNCGFSNPVG